MSEKERIVARIEKMVFHQKNTVYLSVILLLTLSYELVEP